jgi:hypothetical protein
MQSKLVQRLHNHGERTAANWFKKYWTGERGNWSKGHGGVGGIKSTLNNNNGTEGSRWWGGEKKFICSNSGSTAGIHYISTA